MKFFWKMYFSFTIYMLNNASFNDKEKLVMFFVIVVINILMIVFYNEFIKQYKIALNKKAMVEQYNSIKNQVSTMAETNEKMRRIRHDMRNHMIVMEQMLDDKNYDRLKLYMQKRHPLPRMPLVYRFVSGANGQPAAFHAVQSSSFCPLGSFFRAISRRRAADLSAQRSRYANPSAPCALVYLAPLPLWWARSRAAGSLVQPV